MAHMTGKKIEEEYNAWCREQMKKGEDTCTLEEWITDIEYPRIINEIGGNAPDVPVMEDIMELIDAIQDIIEQRMDWDTGEDLEALYSICGQIQHMISTVTDIHGGLVTTRENT